MRKGFTLIEVLVALALFTIIVAIAVGGFANAMRTEHDMAGILAAQSSGSAALEQMAREMRTGYLFCTNDGSTISPSCIATDPSTGLSYCLSTGGSEPWTCTNYIKFYSAEGSAETYQLVNGAIERDSQPITGSDVKVKYMNMVLYGQLLGDHANPRITISIGVAVSSTDPALSSNVLNLQTTVSAREPDSAGPSSY